MKRWLAGAAILVAVLTGLDLAARSFAEGRAADELAVRFDEARAPKVSLGGFPFMMGVIRGRFASVELSAESLTKEGLRLSEVRISLTDITFPPSELLSGDLGSLVAERGVGSASLTAEALNDVLAATGADATVALEGRQALVSAGGLPGRFPARFTLSGRTLIISGEDGPSTSWEIELPRIASGLTYESVEVVDSRAVLRISLKDASLDPPE